IQVDDGPAVTVDCAGADPARTLLSEVTAALNAKIAEGTASHDGRFLRVASPTTGPASTIAFEPPTAEEDATEILFGITPRRFAGVPQRPAQVKGTADLTKHFDAAGEEVDGGVDLGALHLLELKVDGENPIVVNLESA